MIFFREVRGCITLAAGLMAGVSAMPAYAQAQAAEEAAKEEGEILITAQRREQPLQDVPIAISAVGSEELSNRGITDFRELGSAVPSLSVTGTVGVSGNALVGIRGVSNQAVPIGVPQTVAIYIDGEYQPGPFSAFFALDDVERIEVLRGPQGTLYGRNASAGAINIISRMPGETPKVGFDVSYGNYKHVLAKMSASTPIVEGVAFGVSGSFERRGGYFTNVSTGNDIGGVESFTVRGKLRFASEDDAFSALISVDRSEKNGFEGPFYNQFTATGTYVGLQADPYQYRGLAAAEGRIFGGRNSTGGALTLNWKANKSLTLTSITTLRDEDSAFGFDLNSGFPVVSTIPAAAVISQAAKTDKSFGQEVRAQFSSDALDLTVGGNYYKNDESFKLQGTLNTVTVLPFRSPIVLSNLQTYAIFGQAEYHVTDQLTVTGGLRWNKENRDWSVDYRQNIAATGAAAPGLFTSGKIKDSTFIPSGGINFEATDDLMFYAKVSKGYQAPGFNPTPGAAVAAAQFDAEKLLAYEAGIKSQFADKRITLNLASFKYDYDNLQVRNTIGVGQTLITNAGKAKVKGIEASLDLRPTKGLRLSGNLSWNDAKYVQYCEQANAATLQLGSPACTTPLTTYTALVGTATTPQTPTAVTRGGQPGYDRSGNPLINAPKWQWNVALNYELPVGDAGDLRAHVGYSYAQRSFLNSQNDPALTTINPTRKLDARLGFKTNGGLEIYAYGKNLTNNTIVDFAVRGTPTSITSHYSDPRTYGVGLQYRF